MIAMPASFDVVTKSPQRRTVLRQPIASHVAGLLVGYRLRRDMSLPVAEVKTGVGRKTISSLECGRRIEGIKLGLLLALLHGYGVTLGDFADDLRELTGGSLHV